MKELGAGLIAGCLAIVAWIAWSERREPPRKDNVLPFRLSSKRGNE